MKVWLSMAAEIVVLKKTEGFKMRDLFAEHVKTLTAVYEKLAEKYGYERVIVHSGMVDYYFLDDIAQPFRSSPHFNHWVPLPRHANCAIEFIPGSKPRLYYFMPRDYWHAIPQEPDGFWTEFFEITTVESVEQLNLMLSQGRVSSLYLGKDGDAVAEQWGCKILNDGQFVHELYLSRTIKSEYEQECLKIANGLAVNAHGKAAELFFDGASELEIHLAYLQCLGVTENDIPYPNIVGINENAAILHYTNLRSKKVENLSMLIDAGAMYNGYASDITRTYCRDENSIFGELIKALDKKQLQLVDMLKPGRDYVDIHLAAHISVAEVLSEFSIVNAAAEEIVNSGISKAFLPHGVGHFLGLQVHDAGGFLSNEVGSTLSVPEGHPYLRCTRTVEAGNVHTIEPGLYFIDMLLEGLEPKNKQLINWRLVNELKPCGGIRIEDNICTLSDRRINYTRGTESVF